ncbi:LacI family transcriptional regulator [Actinomycetaceae bacterium WB03_NA08]|uniref:LacI family transcriptional regulator n=1 Tax=Scrofimicrobium canadense TaxID=2652290 RepID=A0A6N7VSA2_9ACTO|nr:LacI family DNA-binding transcriptional regulator [Scrofimicrobium canadense]MSS84669.1 LacI family transcriptional regulator [Scrofimicrobium canadense]
MTDDPKAVTLESVGKLAGVSRSTVSRVINGLPGVSERAEQAVQDAINQLGYIPNNMARGLATRRAAVVTALIPEKMDRFFGDPFFGSVISGIEDYMSETPLVLNLMVTSEKAFQKTLAFLAGGQSDGILVLSHHTSHEMVEALERRVPVVYGGRPLRDPTHATYVDADNRDGARKAVQHLVDRKCQRIAMITGPDDMPSGKERLWGFMDVTEESGTLGPIENGDYSAQSGANAARRLLAKHEPFDGLFVANDLMARAAVDILLASGKRIPDDVAVVGFDDSKAAVSSEPLLTTVRQDSWKQGWLMAQLITEMIGGATEPRSIQLPTSLVVRETA